MTRAGDAGIGSGVGSSDNNGSSNGGADRLHDLGGGDPKHNQDSADQDTCGKVEEQEGYSIQYTQ